MYILYVQNAVLYYTYIIYIIIVPTVLYSVHCTVLMKSETVYSAMVANFELTFLKIKTFMS